MRIAVELWQTCQPQFPYQRWTAITHVQRSPDHLFVNHPEYRNHRYEPLPAPLRLPELPSWIMSWLRTAQYPERPNFDGSEAAGFRVFWAHFGSAESDAYGALVVMPAWIEIHK